MKQNEAVRKIHLREFKSISRAIIMYEDLNALFKHSVEGISRSFKVKGCSIMLFDEREKEFFRVSSFGISEEYLSKGPLHVDDKYNTFVKGEPVFIEDMQNSPHVKYPEAAAREGIVSMLSVPMKCRGRIIGIIRVYNNDPWVLHDDDLDSFCLLAEQMGCVIENNGLINFLEQVKIALGSLPMRMLEGL